MLVCSLLAGKHMWCIKKALFEISLLIFQWGEIWISSICASSERISSVPANSQPCKWKGVAVDNSFPQLCAGTGISVLSGMQYNIQIRCMPDRIHQSRSPSRHKCDRRTHKFILVPLDQAHHTPHRPFQPLLSLSSSHNFNPYSLSQQAKTSAYSHTPHPFHCINYLMTSLSFSISNRYPFRAGGYFQHLSPFGSDRGTLLEWSDEAFQQSPNQMSSSQAINILLNRWHCSKTTDRSVEMEVREVYISTLYRQSMPRECVSSESISAKYKNRGTMEVRQD